MSHLGLTHVKAFKGCGIQWDTTSDGKGMSRNDGGW